MCMQDLIISQAVTWRRMAAGANKYAFYASIPRNPNRVALSVTALTGGRAQLVGLDDGSQPAMVGGSGSITVAQWIPRNPLTIFDYPGIFGVDLLAGDTWANIVVFEAVTDPALALVVARGYGDLQALLEKHGGR